MDTDSERELNQNAYERMKGQLASTYPVGRFVAIAGGEVVAEGGNLREVVQALLAQGRDPKRVLVVQAGLEEPDYADILTLSHDR